MYDPPYAHRPVRSTHNTVSHISKTVTSGAVMRKRTKNTLHVLFVIGIVITVTGWFFDRAKSFNWLVSIVAPDYISAKRALSDLEQNERIGLTSNREGFKFLVDEWPNLNDEDSVRYIAGSVAFIAFTPSISNDIELIARDKDQIEIKERWNMSEASAVVESIIDGKLFAFGGFLFGFGIIVSIGSHLITSLTDS